MWPLGSMAMWWAQPFGASALNRMSVRPDIPPQYMPRPSLHPDISYADLLRMMQEMYGERRQ